MQSVYFDNHEHILEFHEHVCHTVINFPLVVFEAMTSSTKQETHIEDLTIQTLAWGFSVDFSEDSEPTDEHGDKLGPLKAEAPPALSELDDVELPGCPREFKDCVSPCTFPAPTPSDCSPREFIFS